MWRMNPRIAGGSCCMGDLGTHAENLVRYITGLEIDSLCADLTTFVKLNRQGSLRFRIYKQQGEGWTPGGDLRELISIEVLK